MKGDLPAGWVETTIGEIVEHNPKNKLDDETLVGFVPMSHMPVSYLSKMEFEERNWLKVKKGYTHFADGDVLLAKITPCFENGKAGIAQNLPNGHGGGSTEYHVLRAPAHSVDPRLLLAFLKTDAFSYFGKINMTGSVGQKRVPKEFLLNYQIPLPPLNEQKRIADKLDTVLAAVGRVKDRLEKAEALLKRFRQSVLNAATTGKLTEEWRTEKSNENAKYLLSKLAVLKKELIEKKTIKKDLAFQSVETIPKGLSSLPIGWEFTNIASVSSKVTDGEHSTPRRTKEGYFLLSARNVTNEGISTRDVDFVPIEEFKRLRKRCDPNKGDILVSCSGSVGRVCVVDRDDAYVMVRSAALIQKLDDYVMSEYLAFALRSPSVQKQMEELSKSTAQSNLFLGEIKSLIFPFPHPKEQQEIVRRVERLFAAADQIEERLGQTRKRVERLESALLAKAFRGELVPQDPYDEPASELLKRIKAERVQQEQQAKPRRRKRTG